MDPREEIPTEQFLCPEGHALEMSRHSNGSIEVIGTTTCGYNDVSRSSPNKPVQPESLKGFTFCCPACLKVYWIKDADSKPARCTALQLLTYMYVVAKNEDGILTGYLKRNHIAAMNTADGLFAEITAMDRKGESVS